MKLGIYCRVSSKRQKEEVLGLEVQRDECIKFCDKNGYSYKVYNDDLSGGIKLSDRDGFNNLLDDLYSKDIVGVVVYDFTRTIRDENHTRFRCTKSM